MWQNMWKKVQKMTKSNPNAAKKDQILHYFKTQWPVLLAVTISGPVSYTHLTLPTTSRV